MKLSPLRAGVALLPLLFVVPAVAQQPAAPTPPAKPAEGQQQQQQPAAQAQQPAAQAPQGQQVPAPKEFTIDAGGWKGGAVPDPKNNQFSHCDISKPFEGGQTLAFTLNPNYLLNVAVVKQNWGLKEGDKGKGRIKVDGAFNAEFDAIGVSPVAMVLPVGPNGDLFAALAKGSKLTVTTPKGEFNFPLTGTGAGLGALKNCVDKARTLLAQAQQGQQGGQPVDPRSLPGAQGFGMTVGGLQDVLAAAGLQNVVIADPRKLPRDPLQINHAWRLGSDDKVIGGLHQEPRGDAVEIDQFAKRYLEIMKSVCRDDWKATEQPAAVLGLNAVKRADLSCKMNNQDISASLVFTLDDNNYSAFFHQGLVADKSQSEDATKKLADFIQKQMSDANATGGQPAPAAGEQPAQPAPAGQEQQPAAPATPPAEGTQPAPAAPASGG